MSLGSIVNLAAGKIAELAVEEAKFLYGVKGEVESLTKELQSMNDLLGKMEAMDEEEVDEQTRTTIKEIRKLSYDAEDVIESYILKAPHGEDMIKRYVCFCSSLVSTHQVGSEINSITESLNETMERWKKYQVFDQYGVTANARKQSKRNVERIRPVAYAHNNEEHLVGLAEDINKLVGVLTMNDAKIQVVSIVGMGGSGKSTLTRKLYNHETLKQYFDCMAWASVSRNWDARQVLTDLLKNLWGKTEEVDKSWSMEEVARRLHEYLKEKTYLIVLDDVWEDEALKVILPTLPLGGDGKKVMITTRNQKIVDYPDLKPFTHTHNARILNEAESWELFTKIACINSEETDHYSMDFAKMEKLGKEMLAKCGGLPLAVIAIAGILRDKHTLDDWERVNKAVGSRIMAEGKGTHLYGSVNQMLLLSYYDMPRELKPCFLYLARYPEDSQISVKMLLQMWIAEGFITSDKLHEGDTLEDVAKPYLQEMIDRCMIHVVQRDYAGEVKAIQVHDLVRDICIKKAREEQFLEVMNSNVTDSRRAAVCIERNIPTSNQHLRSLFYEGEMAPLNLKTVCHHFRLLRVLQMKDVYTSDGILPRQIGKLIHLRYLGLQDTNIFQLPSSIGNLRNLLVLYYKSVMSDNKSVRIPDVIWKIVGLKHLYLPEKMFVSSSVDKLTLHTLTKLQTLSGGNTGGDWMVQELPRLSPSVQKLKLKEIKTKEQLEAAFQCPSIMSDTLHTLYLEWETNILGELMGNVMSSVGKGELDFDNIASMFNGQTEDNDEDLKLDSLESIVHCQRLRNIRLCGKMGDRLAGSGSGIQFPASINKLVLQQSEFRAEDALAALGKLPHLLHLDLSSDAYTGTNWTCSAGDFPQLKNLQISEMPNLEEWIIERGAMHQLKKLTIEKCKKLNMIPEGLKFITTLQELEINGMKDEFVKRIRGEDENGGGEDAHIVQHVPLVTYKEGFFF